MKITINLDDLTIGDLADAVRTGRPAADIAELPAFGANELRAIRASLT